MSLVSDKSDLKYQRHRDPDLLVLVFALTILTFSIPIYT